MRWSKIKNIIILLLVIVNLSLLAQVGLREWRSRRSELETRERMVAVLERNGISYLPQEIPGALDLSGVRVTLSDFGREEAARLVGELTGVEAVGSRTVYTGAEGVVSSSAGGELTVEFSLAAESVILERLSGLGVSLQRLEQTERAVTYIQLLDGVPIPGEPAVLTRENGGCTLTLRRLAGTREDMPGEETLTASTALARFLDELNRGEGYVCSQVIDVYSGYTAGGTTTVTLTPAWFVETDTWLFIVDGYTGNITARE
ncbi:MAG: hypothetical protein HFF05_05940 [Oscillospiraceae bacterium]|nr:hypothetical protein [Oscillospiraceae bacterium]